MSIKQDLIKYTPRQEQLDVLNYIKKVYKEKPDNKFFLLNLPTGIGKSYLSLMLSDFFMSKHPGMKVDLVTAGKALQNQYEDTFEEINSLRGKENYDCLQYSCGCDSGKEFNKINKSSCNSCPYDFARNSYISGEVSLTNFHLFLINALYGSKGEDRATIFGRNSELLIVDEAHELDSVMCDFISVKITDSVIKKFKFSNEEEIILGLKSVVNIETYIDFLRFFLNEIHNTMLQIDNNLMTDRIGDGNPAKRDSRTMQINSILDLESNDVKSMRLINDLRQYSTKITLFIKEYDEKPDNWVLENIYNEKTKLYELSLEPIWADVFLEKYVWSRFKFIVLMSGTILDKKLFSEINGIDSKKSVYYSIPSPFELKNRMIYYMPVGKMSFAKKEETFKKFIPIINRLLKKYHNVKGIVHTNSYELSQWIEKGIRDSRLLFHGNLNKDEVLRSHFESKKPGVLVSPSVGTGISFDNDRARFQIVAKIPYKSLASNKNKLRMKLKPEWYQLMAISSLLQICGRPIRNHLDYADTIIIDSSFGDLLKYASHYLPQWWIDSVKTIKL